MTVANIGITRRIQRDQELTARRQEEILTAASKLFAKYGYPSADLQILADQLSIGKGTLYRYFPSKEELFLAAVDRGVRQLHEYVQARCANVSDPLDRICCAVRSFFAFFDTNPELVELIIQERAEFRHRKEPTYFKHREANIGPWDVLVRGLIEEGRIRPIHIKRIGDKISNMLYGTLFTNHFSRRNLGFEEQTDDVLEVIMLGILSSGERTKRYKNSMSQNNGKERKSSEASILTEEARGGNRSRVSKRGRSGGDDRGVAGADLTEFAAAGALIRRAVTKRTKKQHSET